MQATGKLKGYLFITVAAILWGMIGPFARLAFSEGVLPMEVAFWRAVLAWIFFGSHAVVLREVRMQARDWPALLVFALTGVALFYGSYQLAVKSGGAALASVLLYTAPAWVVVLARIFFKEALTPVKLVALALTLTGVAGVSLGAGGDSSGLGSSLGPGALFAGLTAGFCYSLYYIFGKYFSNRYSSPNLFFYMLPIGAICLFPMVEFSHKTPTAWIALVSMAFFCTYGAYYCYYIGL
ncbi:MAG: DMT family transporter, partial [Desulfobacterales bacterium]|nr:DMT family transporter [Desulfobacterales bacterium]